MRDIPSRLDQQVEGLALDAEQQLPLVGEGVQSHSRWASAPSYVVGLSANRGCGHY